MKKDKKRQNIETSVFISLNVLHRGSMEKKE